MRMAMMERIEAGGYRVTEQPGPNVLFMRWAVSNLYVKKKKRADMLIHAAWGGRMQRPRPLSRTCGKRSTLSR